MSAATYSRVVGSRVVVKATRVVGLHLVSKSNPERNAIIDAADSMRTRVATALIRTVEAVKDAIPLKVLEDKLQRVDLNGVLQVLDLDKRFQAAAKGAGLQPDETSFLEAIKDTWAAGARAELDSLNTVPVRKASNTIGLALAFDLLNPETIAWLSSYVMYLIQQVSDETRRAIADVVMNAFQYGGHPYEQARTIRNMIGLTQSQSQAVANFRRMLENEPLAALTRDLRDHRFDATLQQVGRMKGQLSKEQIDKMAQRYYERYLKYRAEMIARTETIRASRAGQEATWRQAIAQGLLPQNMKRKWVVTYDDRLCKFCRSIPKLNPEGRGMDEQFMSDIGTVDGPPLHPHCRCAIVRKVDWGVSKAEEVEKSNPCHKPAGTSEGGQFCSIGGGGKVSVMGGSFKQFGDLFKDVKSDVKGALDAIPVNMRTAGDLKVYLTDRNLQGVTGSPTASAYFLPKTSGKLKGSIEVSIAKTGDIKRTVVHEYGHAADWGLGGNREYWSDRKAFKDVFLAEQKQVTAMSAAPALAKKFWGTPHIEGFAELYAIAAGQRSHVLNLQEYYPKSFALVKQAFAVRE